MKDPITGIFIVFVFIIVVFGAIPELGSEINKEFALIAGVCCSIGIILFVLLFYFDYKCQPDNKPKQPIWVAR